MILNKESIKSHNLVRNAVDSSWRTASYDLTVGAVITPEGNAVDDYPLNPQGVLKVVSAEVVDLPPNISGYVHVKTGLCNEGVLTLNIGIVDPCFCGPLQSTVLNFGKTTFRLRKGDVFGRITFHEQMAPEKPPEKFSRTFEQAKNAAISDVDKYLAPDFLDFSRTVEKAADEANEKHKKALFVYVPAFALLLALLTLFLNFGNMMRLERYIDVKDRVTETRKGEDMDAKVARMEEDAKRVNEEMRLLRERLDQALAKPVGPTKQSGTPANNP